MGETTRDVIRKKQKKRMIHRKKTGVSENDASLLGDAKIRDKRPINRDKLIASTKRQHERGIRGTVKRKR